MKDEAGRVLSLTWMGLTLAPYDQLIIPHNNLVPPPCHYRWRILRRRSECCAATAWSTAATYCQVGGHLGRAGGGAGRIECSRHVLPGGHVGWRALLSCCCCSRCSCGMGVLPAGLAAACPPAFPAYGVEQPPALPSPAPPQTPKCGSSSSSTQKVRILPPKCVVSVQGMAFMRQHWGLSHFEAHMRRAWLSPAAATAHFPHPARPSPLQLPTTSAAAGNGVEVGCYEDTWRFLEQHGEENGWL